MNNPGERTNLPRTSLRPTRPWRDYRSATVPHLIGGEWRLSISGNALARLLTPRQIRARRPSPPADAADIDRAAKAAVAAFPAWRAFPPMKRRKFCTRSPTALSRGPMKSLLSRAPIPASRSATWRRRRCAARKTSAFLPTKRRPPAMASPCPTWTISTIRCANR